jgi:hypothetical protein
MKLKISVVCLLLIISAFAGLNFASENAKGATYFQDDFEPAPSPGWVADGFWAVRDDGTTSCAPPSAFSPTHTYWYGQEASCNYDNGARNMGNLTTSRRQ